jgi:Restriction alleviation protein Lar
MPEPLAPCPFCASVAIEVWESTLGGAYATAVCRDCHACGPEGRSLEEAQALWNARPRADGRQP